jgi:hypothetical protein
MGGLLWGDLFPKTYNGRASDLGDEGIPKGATTRVEGIGANGEGLLSRALELLVKVDGVATGDGFRGFPLK